MTGIMAECDVADIARSALGSRPTAAGADAEEVLPEHIRDTHGALKAFSRELSDRRRSFLFYSVLGDEEFPMSQRVEAMYLQGLAVLEQAENILKLAAIYAAEDSSR